MASAWGKSWAGFWGNSWGSVETELDALGLPKKNVPGTAKRGKLHLAELYKKQHKIKDYKREAQILQMDNDLIAILGLLVSNRIIN